MGIFANFDFDEFWTPMPDVGDGSFHSYRERTIRIGKPVNSKMIQDTQKIFGYKLPRSYIEFLQSRNGGMPRKTLLMTEHLHDYPHKCLRIERFLNIDRGNYCYSVYSFAYRRCFFDNEYRLKAPKTVKDIKALLSKKPNVFPDIGIYFAPIYELCSDIFDNFLAFDYRHCDDNGEPQIVHVQLERDGVNDKINIYFIAKNFETFIRSLI